MYCTKCGAVIPDGAVLCASCSSGVVNYKKKCPRCGNMYGRDMVYCENCGTLLEGVLTSPDAPPYLTQIGMVSFFAQSANTSAGTPAAPAARVLRAVPKSVGSLFFYNDRLEFEPMNVAENIGGKWRSITGGGAGASGSSGTSGASDTSGTSGVRDHSDPSAPSDASGTAASRVIAYRDIAAVEEGVKFGMPGVVIRLCDGTECAFSKIGSQMREAAAFLREHLR